MVLFSLLTLFVLMVVLTTLKYSDACSCARLNLTNEVCDSSFVGVVQILEGPSICPKSVLEPRYKHRYSVQTIEQLSPACPDLSTLRTPTHESSCGRKFIKGRQYLVAGNPTPHEVMATGLCRFVVDWSNLKQHEKDHYRNYLRKISC